MISVIVCSRSERDFEALKNQLRENAGAETEYIRIPNENGHRSIFQAYNEGIRQAKGEWLCFAHEDIRIHTKNWAGRCERHFAEDPALGLLGVVGGCFFPSDGDWRAFPGCRRGHLLQRVNTLEATPRAVTAPIGGRNFPGRVEVAAIDGLWMVLRADLGLRFDEDSYRGFDLYDSDLSLQVRQAGAKVCVCGDLLIEHFSYGNFSPSYFSALEVCLKKWQGLLPLNFDASIDPKADHSALLQAFYEERMARFSAREKLLRGEVPNEAKEVAAVREDILLFHHVYEKTSPTLADSLREIDRSQREGWITPAEARSFRWKSYLYHLFPRKRV